MTTTTMTTTTVVPLFLAVALLLNLPAEIVGRVGNSNHENNDIHQRNLGVGNSNPVPQPVSYQNTEVQYSKHHGYYYIKRPVDPSEYYHNYNPNSTPTNHGSNSKSNSQDSYDDDYDDDHSEPEPADEPETKRPTNPIPVSSPGISAPTKAPQPLPTEEPVPPPTEAPVPPPTEAPVPPPTEAPAAPVRPPTFEPAIDIEIVNGDGDGDNSPKEIIPKPPESDGEQTTITFEPPSQIQLRIQDFSLKDGAEFEDPLSYQSKALKRVEEQAGVQFFTDVKLMQYYTLYSIFEATNSESNDFILQSRVFGDGAKIPGWKITSGWLENNLDPCEGEWYGIECVDDQVISVDLFDNDLTGNFPPEVVLLAGDGFYSTGAGNLVTLDIFNNEFMSNNGDNSWIQDLGSQLGYLYLQNTMFSGKLPPKFPDGLVELDIANSMITGDLSGAAFENLTSLRFLLMDGVQFNSSIPTEIASLPNLEYLFASDSLITGDLSYMENMSVIFEHWVDRNPDLGGTIPSFVGDLTTLQSFSIAECGFEGTIPEQLGNLELMQQMWLYGNQLSGEIPASLGNLSFLRIFEVEDNLLSDSMPKAICDNIEFGMLQVLGADCDRLDCPCCTCCTADECRNQD